MAYESYTQRLKRQREERQQHTAATPAPLPLKSRIENWWAGLSEEEQAKEWKMEEFTMLFKCTPPRIGAALFELGFVRRREYRPDRPNCRLWKKL